MFLFELVRVDLHGPAAAAFALMAALGGSAMALLGALHPLWRLNMLAMTVLTVLTMVAVALILPESPIWLMRKGREAAVAAVFCCPRVPLRLVLCSKYF